MPVALTVGLGKFIAGLRYPDIPKDAIAFTQTGFTDCVGVMPKYGLMAAALTIVMRGGYRTAESAAARSYRSLHRTAARGPLPPP